jgi:acylpyruvate hydrolase
LKSSSDRLPELIDEAIPARTGLEETPMRELIDEAIPARTGLEETPMRFASFRQEGIDGLAVVNDAGSAIGLTALDPNYPGKLETLIQRGMANLSGAAQALNRGRTIDLDNVEFLPLLSNPGKIICVGLNYSDHSAESGFKQPDYPTIFSRFNSSLIGHGAPLVRPAKSNQLDYEGELAAVIGTGGKNIPKARALDHVIGYAIFNDASVRDYRG